MTNSDTSKKFDSVQLYRMRKLLSELSSKTGRGTELVTLYLPPKKPIHEAIAALREESGTASNIKSDTTRAHVQDALTKTIQRLRLYKQTPENGLIIFCGAIPGPGGPGKETIELYEVLPSKPVTNYLYRCDDHFHLDPLREMLKEENVIGVLALDATEAGLGIVSGDSWEVVDVTSSGVSGKTRKGGQCVGSDTLVQLEDGRLVPISEISPGSRIASYDFVNYKNAMHQCADTFSVVPKEYYEIRTKRPGVCVRATGEHRFFTLGDNGVSTKQAFELKPGDRLLFSCKLPEPSDPVLSTQFPSNYRHEVSVEGRRIMRDARIERRLSQAKLANILGICQTEISQVERGERNLKWLKLRKIVSYLCVSEDEFVSKYVTFKRTLPEFFTKEILQLLGYVAGVGNASENRINLIEQRREVANLYSNLAKLSLGLEYVPIFMKNKIGRPGSSAKHEYLETRIYSKDFVDALRAFYPGLVSTTSRDIPEQIHRLDNEHLAHFLRGLFDAQGCVRTTRVGIAMKSGVLIRQLQMLLLRFGIVSSYKQHVNRYGSIMHALDIGDYSSIESFSAKIGFSSPDKSRVLKQSTGRPRSQSYLNNPALGSWIDKRAKKLGISRRQFSGITNFFHDQRGISREVFGGKISTFETELEHYRSSSVNSAKLNLLEDTVLQLSMIQESELVLAHVHEVKRVENKRKDKFIDIELPSTRSFIGNGFALHNSARRYERLREMELTDYYNRLADHSKKAFLEQYNVKGLIVSGPGPTKDQFVKDNYLDYRLQKAIIGVLDTGYAGREGVRETIEKSGDLLQNVRVVEESKLVQKFLREINSDSGLAMYGVDDVIRALKRAAVDIVLISDDSDLVYLRATCVNGDVREKFIKRSQYVSEKQTLLSTPCPECGNQEIQILEKDIVDYFADLSLDSGARVEVISSKTEDGSMLKSFGGVSALLRYKV